MDNFKNRSILIAYILISAQIFFCFRLGSSTFRWNQLVSGSCNYLRLMEAKAELRNILATLPIIVFICLCSTLYAIFMQFYVAYKLVRPFSDIRYLSHLTVLTMHLNMKFILVLVRWLSLYEVLFLGLLILAGIISLIFPSYFLADCSGEWIKLLTISIHALTLMTLCLTILCIGCIYEQRYSQIPNNRSYYQINTWVNDIFHDYIESWRAFVR